MEKGEDTMFPHGAIAYSMLIYGKINLFLFLSSARLSEHHTHTPLIHLEEKKDQREPARFSRRVKI